MIRSGRTGALPRCALAFALLLASPRLAAADAGTLSFSPEHTHIAFTLAATLHEVHGTLALRSGALHFDAASGSASGTLVIDARSAQTGNARRDAAMHADVLESRSYPEIVFEAQRLELTRQSAERGEAVLHGRVRIHGGVQALAIPAHLEREGADAVRVRATFRVPYVAWGLRDPSNFVLRVSPDVEVTVDARASYGAAAGTPP